MVEYIQRKGWQQFTAVVRMDSANVYQKGRSRTGWGGKRKTSEEVDKPSYKENATSEGTHCG
jgi:hypothetical protein